MRVAVVIIVATATALLAGCSSDGGGALPEQLTCTTQYRPNAGSTEGADERTFTVDPTDSSTTEGTSVEFPSMTVTVYFAGDAPEGNNVRVVVTDAGGAEITSVLYQVGEPGLQDIDFAGGHGFTGLHYVSHEQATLQFFCGARPDEAD